MCLCHGSLRKLLVGSLPCYVRRDAAGSGGERQGMQGVGWQDGGGRGGTRECK